MFKSGTTLSVVVAAMLILFPVAQVPAQHADVLSGRDLLRAVRDGNDTGQRPAYETRLNQTMSPAEAAAGQESKSPPLAPAPEAPEESAATQAAPSPGPTAARDELLGMIPAESLFCIRVNNPDFALSQMDQFLAGASPMPMGTSVLVRTQLAGILGSPEIKGIDMAGSFAISGPLLGTNLNDPGNIALLVPVTDYEQFVSGNPNIGEPDERGISKITSKGIPPLLVTKAKNYALITPQGNDGELLVMAKAISSNSMLSLADALEPAEAGRAATEAVWAYANIQQVSATFGPQFSAWIQQAKEATKNRDAKRQESIKRLEEMKNAMDPADPEQKSRIEKIEQSIRMLKAMKSDNQTAEMFNTVMDMYAAILQTMMNETKSVSLTLNPKPDVLYTTITVSAVPATSMADLFTTNVSAKEHNKLMPYLEDGAVANLATRKFLGASNAKAMELFAPMLSEICGTDKSRLTALTADFATVLSGSDAMSFSVDPAAKPPFVGKYVIEISDEAKLNKVIRDGIELFNTGGIGKFYEALGLKTHITLNHGVGEYKGATVDAAELTFEPTDPNSFQGQIIAAMYGGGFNYRWATIDGLWLLTFGGDADASLRKLIDQVKAGGPKQLAPEIKSALDLLPDAGKADFVATINALRYFKMLTAMTGTMMPVPMPWMDVQTGSNIVMAGSIDAGTMTTKIALPKQHLTEIMAAVQNMMQQKTKMQRESMVGP